MVNENFKRAYKIDSINTQKFYWRINGLDPQFKYIRETLSKNEFLKPHDNIPSYIFNPEEDKHNIKELTIAEIVLGSQEYNYPGLLKLCDAATTLFCYKDEVTLASFSSQLEFIGKRATGKKYS
jgi:hypothetical protein